jgi:hypothetical protein
MSTQGIFEKRLVDSNRRTYDLNYVVKNIQLGVEGDDLNIPVWNSVEGSEETGQQTAGKVESGCTSRKTLQRDRDIWRTQGWSQMSRRHSCEEKKDCM